ncbi:cytoskeleton-associated protein CAP5.5 [Novymonas esmeraldas]|uniref:Cytoskeleton-associated protein CAP5.5 n=1 Tax=Novymonas esmeraldas TaxID=1808958 RepID=A0AAW0EPM4_9TRYP
MGCCNSKDTKKPKASERPQPKAAEKQPVRPTVQEARREETPVRAEAPVDPRAERIKAIGAHNAVCPYRYDACTVDGGELKGYFEGGIVYRITKNGAWYVYNDSLDYEAHVDFRFGPGSKITAGERTTLEELADGWTCAHAVVYPLETLHYISGTPNGYKSGITIKPLSEEYRHEACAAANSVAEAETAAVRRVADGETDEEAILRRCVATRTPYVDLTFPPSSEAVVRAGVDGRTIPEMAMARPTQYLPAERRAAVNDIVGPVVAQSIDEGALGDSWLMCAAATIAEEEAAVRSLFSQGTKAEKAVGAYRVTINKNGWWRTVIVDDYLPTINRVPVFARSRDNPSELWASLLQKAYAKVHGSYAAVTGGDALQALVDFTGSPMYRFDKEWEAAATSASKAEALAASLVQFSRVGASIVLSTPGHTSESYLGRRQTSDPAAFRARYAAVGLRGGYTYFVERVVTVKKRRALLFKLRNPWRSSARWTGPWSYGAAQWKENPDVCSVCGAQEDPHDGSFWMEWEDVSKYFDGGGVIFANPDATDYRVKGTFEDTTPSAVLEVTASEPTRVLLSLSQPDKRGVDRRDGAALFAPITLTVSRKDGDVQRVEANASWNPEQPTQEFNFIVGRDVALWFTLQPGEHYQIVPRIHRKGVRSGYDRPYVIGIISQRQLEGTVQVEAKHLSSGSNAFTNFIAYGTEETPSVEVEHQMRLPGKAPVTYVSSTVI